MMDIGEIEKTGRYSATATNATSGKQSFALFTLHSTLMLLYIHLNNYVLSQSLPATTYCFSVFNIPNVLSLNPNVSFTICLGVLAIHCPNAISVKASACSTSKNTNSSSPVFSI